MLSDRAEDYLEAILIVQMKKGYVRVKDLAVSLNVKYPSVSEMLKKLQSSKLISYEKYGCILLTDKGLEIARSIKDRHDTLVRLLVLSGVPEEVAQKDACTLEHRLSPRSLEGLKTLVSSLEQAPDVRLA